MIHGQTSSEHADTCGFMSHIPHFIVIERKCNLVNLNHNDSISTVIGTPDDGPYLAHDWQHIPPTCIFPHNLEVVPSMNNVNKSNDHVSVSMLVPVSKLLSISNFRKHCDSYFSYSDKFYDL